jgi:hypothetical protein
VINRGSGLRFANEPEPEVAVTSEFLPQDFQGYLAAETLVTRAEYRPHSARADRGLNTVVGDTRANSKSVPHNVSPRVSTGSRTSVPNGA